MSPLKSSKLMWPQSSELKSTSLTCARCPIKASTSQNVRVIPSVQNLDEAFLTTCKMKANIFIYSTLKTNIFAISLVGLKRDYTSGEKKRHVFAKTKRGILDNKERHRGVFPRSFCGTRNWRIAKYDWIPGALWFLRLNVQVKVNLHSLSFCQGSCWGSFYRGGSFYVVWGCYPHFLLHTSAASVVAVSSHE